MSWYSTLRSAIARRSPPSLRQEVRHRLSQARWLEAQSRKVVPHWLGGRVPHKMLTSRVLGVADARRIAELRNRGTDEALVQSLQASMESTESFIVGVFLRERLVAQGWCGPQWSNIGLPGIWVGGGNVRPGFRHRGIGQFMHQRRLEEARRRQIHELYVNVAESNHASLGACRAVGFTPHFAPQWSKAIE